MNTARRRMCLIIFIYLRISVNNSNHSLSELSPTYPRHLTPLAPREIQRDPTEDPLTTTRARLIIALHESAMAKCRQTRQSTAATARNEALLRARARSSLGEDSAVLPGSGPGPGLERAPFAKSNLATLRSGLRHWLRLITRGFASNRKARPTHFPNNKTNYFTSLISFDGMAITTDVKLSRANGQPWGFRLSGGVNFAFPLTAVKVAIGSLAHTAGLQAGDIIVRLNGEPISQLTHVQAHDKLVSAGNDVVLSVMRNHEIAQRQQ
ncbi:hypothetical protein HN011_000710 [Eciton burchellii]|nr:hypothetical protein HN011_000710 [Eciton burchellii]